MVKSAKFRPIVFSGSRRPRPDESWGQWVRRLWPRECQMAEQRLNRSERLYKWPSCTRVKQEYRRRRR